MVETAGKYGLLGFMGGVVKDMMVKLKADLWSCPHGQGWTRGMLIQGAWGFFAVRLEDEVTVRS